MFKRYSDFAQTPPADHPGQPAHCDHKFDVWPSGGKFIVIPTDAPPVEFESVNTAREYAAGVLATTKNPPEDSKAATI